MKLPQTGGCQCGAVRYEVTGQPLAMMACHCTECQRQSGSAFGMSMSVNTDDVRVDGTLKSFTRKADSGGEVTGFFCPECGTRIYHQSPMAPGRINIKPGTLDDTSWVAPKGHLWLAFGQKWLTLPDDHVKFDRQPADFSVFRYTE